MDVALMAVAERLVEDFSELNSTTVLRVLKDCADELPDDDSHLVEQAARARLSAARATTSGMAGQPDTLDVPLHDDDLGHEVELVGHFIVAANESDGPLSQEDIDRILGVSPSSRGD